ncbi:MAG: RraA family protein [Halanaerobiaceae bacterium]
MSNNNSKERDELLDLFSDLRVADVRDGMDFVGLHHYGSMDPDIRPLERVRACGIARTARYLPYEGEIPEMTPEEYGDWSGWYYSEVCTYPWMDEIKEGDFVVIDQSRVDAGLMGSNNALAGKKEGVNGYVTNGGVRDTDEIIIEEIPFWSRMISQSMVQGRLRYDDHDIPVNVGGVQVNPGDVVVADGDGVIVVPRDKAFAVAKWAHGELENDKKGRKQLYKELGMELDDTVK